MTTLEFAQKMREISKYGDIEESHGKADDLMCRLLRELGYGDGIDIFEAMDKWYA